MSSFSLTETWKTIAPTIARPAIRRTKIVCTLGPATTDPETVYELAAAGMDVARLNFSHGSHDEHLERLAAVRIAQDRLGRPIAVLADLCGPKIRVTGLREPMQVTAGDTLVLTAPELAQGRRARRQLRGSARRRSWLPGDEVLIDDGRIRARAEGSDGTRLLCRVEVGGTIKPSKGVNLPSSSLPIPALTEKDRADLQFALAAGADYIALSFVRTAEDVEELRSLIDAAGSPARIIAKIEKAEAVVNLDEIIEVADAVMVARGDLGVEIGVSQVPLVQKRIIERARDAGRAGDHRDADARVDDPRARADAGGGVRRRERDPRRHVRRDALGRDRRGRVPAAGGGADGRDRALGGAVARLRAPRRAWRGRCGDPDPRRVRPRRRRRRARDRRPDRDRRDGAARLPVPAAGPDRGGGEERRRPPAARARVGGRAAPRRRGAARSRPDGRTSSAGSSAEGSRKPATRSSSRAGQTCRSAARRTTSSSTASDEPEAEPRTGSSATAGGCGRWRRARRSPVADRADELLRRFGSPLYVYDLREVERRYRRFVQAFPYRPLECHYALVCNKNPLIVRRLHELGAGVHANTPGDAFAALAAGVPAAGRRLQRHEPDRRRPRLPARARGRAQRRLARSAAGRGRPRRLPERRAPVPDRRPGEAQPDRRLAATSSRRRFGSPAPAGSGSPGCTCTPGRTTAGSRASSAASTGCSVRPRRSRTSST